MIHAQAVCLGGPMDGVALPMPSSFPEVGVIHTFDIHMRYYGPVHPRSIELEQCGFFFVWRFGAPKKAHCRKTRYRMDGDGVIRHVPADGFYL